MKSHTPTKKVIAAAVVSEFSIGANDLETVYISPDPFYGTFEEELDLRKFDFTKHATAGLNFLEKG